MAPDRVLIVGTGFAGLGMAIRLKQAGIQDFTVLEQAAGVGGTWRDNTYPGAACDIESHLYSFSFEQNPRWSRTFAPQAEILAYLEHCADKYGLRPHIRFNTAATAAAFDEQRGLWDVQCSDGTTRQARVLVAACGGLSRPSYPEIKGLSAFQGTMFHSARWDHNYPLEGKTVAVIGTGASAIQIVPAIAPRVARLQLYQRTPAWILPKPDGPITVEEQEAFAQHPATQRRARRLQYSRHELVALGFVAEPRLLKLASRLALKHLDSSILNPALRAKLTPSYTMGCKRVLLSNDFYPALNRANVDLITEGIEEIRESSVVTRDGTDRPVDAIVLATGFQAAEVSAPFEILGRRGRDLNDAWRDGPEAYLGTTVSGFPNLFIIVGPNTGLGHSSMVFMIESQIEYIMDGLRELERRRLKFVDVRAEAQAEYNARLQPRFARTVWSTGCVSWYRTRSGRNTTLWPGFTFEFRLRTRRFDLDAYEQVKSSTSAAVV